jgi:hypothetical protein
MMPVILVKLIIVAVAAGGCGCGGDAEQLPDLVPVEALVTGLVDRRWEAVRKSHCPKNGSHV